MCGVFFAVISFPGKAVGVKTGGKVAASPAEAPKEVIFFILVSSDWFVIVRTEFSFPVMSMDLNSCEWVNFILVHI